MNENTKKLDILAIGDIVIDAFIKLQDAHVHCNIDKEGCELCMRFGDKIPYESVTVISAAGNSGNAAVCTARLGANTAIIANIGDDQNGKDCLKTFESEKVMTDFVTSEKNKLTNYHYVLWYETERTILVRHQSYERKWPEILESGLYGSPSWIYFSSLGENSLPFHDEVIEYLKRHRDVKLAFQPGTFQMKFGPEKLKEVYAHTDAFFCNKEEAERILGIPARNASREEAHPHNLLEPVGEAEEEIEDLLKLSKGIETLGPKMIFISDGGRGAYFYQKGELWHIPVYPNLNPPFERTGAGDAFSATITCALSLGFSPIEAFSWGPINSMSVIQYVGAQEGLLSREKILEYLKNAPEDYKAKKLN